MTDDETLYEFDIPFQRKIVALFTRDTLFAQKTKDLIDPAYFTEDACKALVRIIQDHVQVYNAVPDAKILPSILRDALDAKRLRRDVLDEVKALVAEVWKADITNPKFVQEKVASFAKHQAMEQAIMGSVGLLEKGEFEKISELMKKALAVGIDEESDDYDYHDKIADRSKHRDDILHGRILKTGITSGHAVIDAYLYHNGWGRKELSCLMGPAKSGKSGLLGEFAMNASLAGYNVLYISAEVSKEIIAERLDAGLSNTLMKEMHKNIPAIEAAIAAAKAKGGILKIRDVASGTMRPSAIRRMLDKYRNDGIIFDLVVVDYADILAAEHRSDDQRENLRTIYIDLRAIAHDYNIALLTATQTNRDGAKAATAKATDVGDDWNKARTVDILIGINATDAEKAAGKARLYWALSRNTEDGLTIEIEQDRSRMKFLKKILGVK